MSGLINIAVTNSINPKRVSSKLSFEVGQVFAARIVSANEKGKEFTIKLLDGWQFPARFQVPVEVGPKDLIKFQVVGFQDGRLNLKVVNNKEDNPEDSKNSLMKSFSDSNIDVDKNDYDIIKKMIKHSMPLTKDNISRIKTLVDFREKLLKDEQQADSFIFKYVNSKNIDINSIKGKETAKALQGFFNELKNISEDELLTMLENNIDVNEDNIKSFIKLFRDDKSIYEELKVVSEKLDLYAALNPKELSSQLETTYKQSNIAELIKEKTEEMKNIIKSLLNGDKDFHELKDISNDFKIFNSVSGKYYCLDVPVNVNRGDYRCKLLIKDDRKSGKRIDSKNVSMVVSVKTIRLGTVDAYIKVKEQNMNVDMKCDEAWVKMLSRGKNIMLEELTNLGYTVFLNIDKKQVEASLTNCREFFEDSELKSINVKV